jgi:CRP-like cAMP-binding protein
LERAGDVNVEKEIATLSDGKYFGEMALLEDNLKLRSAKVIAKTDCHFLCMEREIIIDKFLVNEKKKFIKKI